jgi:phage terminase Nu1 subunit (DNA packaging protein)
MSRDGGGWSINAAAEELGRDRRTVTKAAKKCRPVAEDARGKRYDLGDLARALYDKGGGDLDLNAEKARLARAQAEKAELDLAERRGELFPRGLIERTWLDVAMAIRSKVLALKTLAPTLVGLNLQDIEEELDARTREMLEELQGHEPGDYRDPLVGADGADGDGPNGSAAEADG